MTTKARMVLRAMTEHEINARITQLTNAINHRAGVLKRMRWERRGLLIALAHRRLWKTNPAIFQKARDSRRPAGAA